MACRIAEMPQILRMTDSNLSRTQMDSNLVVEATRPPEALANPSKSAFFAPIRMFEYRIKICRSLLTV
jgi:hypothetical protein